MTVTCFHGIPVVSTTRKCPFHHIHLQSFDTFSHSVNMKLSHNWEWVADAQRRKGRVVSREMAAVALLFGSAEGKKGGYEGENLWKRKTCRGHQVYKCGGDRSLTRRNTANVPTNVLLFFWFPHMSQHVHSRRSEKNRRRQNPGNSSQSSTITVGV